MKHRHGLGWVAGSLALVVALLSPPGRAGDPAPAAAFAQLEARLLAAESVSLDFHITAEGALAADLRGKLWSVGNHTLHLFAQGEFGGEPVTIGLFAEDGNMALGGADELTATARPRHLAEAVLVGLTRMGLLHNLARLTADAAPDHANGGVREWVTVGDFAGGQEVPAALSFAITVAGSPAATARLELDDAGLPSLRQQTVQFPGGEMQVTERYSGLVIEP
ncbi:MAG: hypothetical protein RJQ10_00670 [Haliea sp.]|uniref:hypothetical protein n=1 Tax=Haliea sp. TaxID=1932666 RepID=UPI0032EF898B